MPGSVALVGAGPGDPDLLTIAALRAIESADVIYHDELVSPEILSLAGPRPQLVNVGKRGYGPSCKQSDINELIVRSAQEGKRVVRLKSGDPLIFGRGGEEINACLAAGVSVEIIPGVTSAQAAAARLRISLTHRDHARRVQYITGHDRNGSLPADINWQAIADPGVTTVVYMPSRTIRELSAKAIAHGLPPDTPALAIANATRRAEHALFSTIEAIADDLENNPPGSPVLVMIGKVFGKENS